VRYAEGKRSPCSTVTHWSRRSFPCGTERSSESVSAPVIESPGDRHPDGNVLSVTDVP